MAVSHPVRPPHVNESVLHSGQMKCKANTMYGTETQWVQAQGCATEVLFGIWGREKIVGGSRVIAA